MVDQIKQIEANDTQRSEYDTSDKEQVNKARKKLARTRADRLRFIEAAMNTKEGRAWFNDILNYCDVFGELFNDDAYRTAFLCGRRNVGIRILDDIQTIAGDNYITMVKESKQ